MTEGKKPPSAASGKTAPPPAPDRVKKEIPLSDRLPPSDVETEMAVLGAMMLDQEAAARVFEILKDETVFFKESHRKIFLAAQRLYGRNDPIDLHTMSETLHAVKQLEEVGGAAYLAELVGRVSSPANAEHHAYIILRKSLLRKTIQTCDRAINYCYTEPDDVDELLDGVENEIFHLMQFRRTGGFRPIGPLLINTFERLEIARGDQDGIIGVRSGYEDLDKKTSGFQAGDMIVLAGRPSMGKTAFSLNIARNAAVDQRTPVGIFSLEMASHQLALRMLCAEAGVNSAQLRSGKLEAKKFQKLPVQIGKLAEAPIYVDDTPSLSVMELRARARRLKSEFNVGLIIIDYLGLMEATQKKVESQQQKIADISRALKALAKDLQVPVLVISQLSRAVEARGGDRRPILSDLRDSGAIEQDADVVLFIFREGVYDSNKDKSVTEIIIAKQRNGPTGTLKVKFNLETGRFEPMAASSYEQIEEGVEGYPF